MIQNNNLAYLWGRDWIILNHISQGCDNGLEFRPIILEIGCIKSGDHVEYFTDINLLTQIFRDDIEQKTSMLPALIDFLGLLMEIH